MIRVERKGKEHFEKKIRKFKRKVDDAGIISEFRSKSYYEKPSEIRRRKFNRRKKNLRKIREELDFYEY